MATAYKIINNKSHRGDFLNGVPSDFTPYTAGQEPQELLMALAYKTPEETVAHLKSLYLGVVDAKLKELDYDSLATVKLWEDDPAFGAEASKILAWYKSIIAYNYSLLTSGVIPSDEDYLAGIPIYG